MKLFSSLFFVILLTTSCQMEQNVNANDEHTEYLVPDTTKSTAIFWIDKSEFKNCKEYAFRTIKARVLNLMYPVLHSQIASFI